jgi:threonine dehydrogenase-like Zn-dependent dehydrogenase
MSSGKPFTAADFGTVSVVGVYGSYLDKIPMGSAINRGLTFRMALSSRPR